jgi:hypothetical protein
MQAPVPSALVAQGEATVLTVHAEGAQIVQSREQWREHVAIS